jgi:hypothetical protein
VADPNRALSSRLFTTNSCSLAAAQQDCSSPIRQRAGIRPTKGVDAIADVTSYGKYAALSEHLRALGLAEDATPDAPLCRWLVRAY